MKKNKFIGITAAALLAVAPVAAIAENVNAATTQSVWTSSYAPVFEVNGQKVGNTEIAPLGNGLSIKNGETIDQVLGAIKKAVTIKLPDGMKGQTNILTTAQFIALQLRNQGVKVSGYTGSSTITDVGKRGIIINLEVQSNVTQADGKVQTATSSVKVPFNPSATDEKDAPVINLSYTQGNKSVTTPVYGQIFQVKANSKFNPTDFVGTNGSNFKFSAGNAKLTVVSNTVDTSKAGSTGEVTLKATNGNKSTEISYTVLVKPEGARTLDLSWQSTNWTYIYGVSSQNSSEINPVVLDTPDRINEKDTIFVGNDTTIIDGVSYSRISQESQAQADEGSYQHTAWIKTYDLLQTNGTNSSNTRTLMHAARAYDSKGRATKVTYSTFKQLDLSSTVTIIGKARYYQVNGTDQFIKAANVDGTKRMLKHNAYVYATSTRRADYTLLKKGTSITTYGGSYKFKNGKRYYRVEGATATNKRYVKVSNFN